MTNVARVTRCAPKRLASRRWVCVRFARCNAFEDEDDYEITGLWLSSLTSLASRRPESRTRTTTTRTSTITSTRMRSARFTLAQGEAK
jgi:hypothetical protein